MGITVERKYSVKQTDKILYDFFSKYKKCIKYELLCCKNDSYPTYVSYAKTKDNKLITRGNGKGIEEQSRLSALFECIEHSFYESFCFKFIFPLRGVKYLPFSKITKYMSTDFTDNPLFENMRNLANNSKLPCLKYKSLFSQKYIYLPLFMYGPSYPYPALTEREAEYVDSIYMKDSELTGELLKLDNYENYKDLADSLKYCSSVGGASGIDQTETLLHAVNEVIERDTSSEFLLSAIIYENYDKYSIIEKGTLNESNRQIVEYLEKEYNIDIIITDITGKIGIPTVMVHEANNKFGEETLFNGYGTSTNIEYAIERALLEYKQTIDLVLYDKTLPKADNYLKILEEQHVDEFFKKLYYFDYKNLEKIKIVSLDKIKQSYIQFEQLKNPSLMLSKVLSILKKNGYTVYCNIKKDRIKLKEYVYYVKVVIPQMCDITDPGPLRMPNKGMLIRVKGEINKNV